MQYIMGDVVAPDFELLFQIIIFTSTISRRSTVIFSQTMTDMAQVVTDNERNSYMSYRVAYLHLTLAHCKGQGQRHVPSDNDYLGNGAR